MSAPDVLQARYNEMFAELEEVRKKNAELQMKLDQRFTLEEFVNWKLEISACNAGIKRLQKKFELFVQEHTMDKLQRKTALLSSEKAPQVTRQPETVYQLQCAENTINQLRIDLDEHACANATHKKSMLQWKARAEKAESELAQIRVLTNPLEKAL